MRGHTTPPMTYRVNDKACQDLARESCETVTMVRQEVQHKLSKVFVLRRVKYLKSVPSDPKRQLD